MKKPLSFTAYKLYHECPAKYDLHYNKRIRAEVIPAFFVFGSAIDKGANALLEGKNLEEAIVEARTELGRLLTEKVEYDERDYDGELIEDKQDLLDYLRLVGYKGDNVDGLVAALLEKQANGVELSEGQTRALATCMKECMSEKARILLAGYVREVLPKIRKVVSVQKEVKRGIADAEVELHGVDVPVILDNKTAYRLYEPDAVVTSIQLAGYGGEYGAYVVMDKNIKKNRIKTCSVCGHKSTGRHSSCDAKAQAPRVHEYTKFVTKEDGESVETLLKKNIEIGDRCEGEWEETIQPEAVIQIVKDPISKEQRELVESAYQQTEKAIGCSSFPKNLSACQVNYGKKRVRCPYYDYCRSGAMKGLIKKEDE